MADRGQCARSLGAASCVGFGCWEMRRLGDKRGISGLGFPVCIYTVTLPLFTLSPHVIASNGDAPGIHHWLLLYRN
jgi:hypothetical protein